MAVYNASFDVKTSRRSDMIDITAEVERVIADSGVENGSVCVYCPHTTAGITINENADPDVIHDILLTLAELIPHKRAGYKHAEGNSDAHVKSSLLGSSQTVLIEAGGAKLGTWQSVFFCEFDGPRSRKVLVQIQS